MDKSKLFVTSCVSLVTTAMVFAVRGDIEPAMREAFKLTAGTDGTDLEPGVLGVHAGDFHQRRACRSRGHANAARDVRAWLLVGVALVLLAPYPPAPVESIFATTGTTLLYVGFFIMGLSQGLVEGVINPLIATIYSDEKTKRLNRLHAWWPGGMIIGGLLAYALTSVGAAWQIKLSLICCPQSRTW